MAPDKITEPLPGAIYARISDDKRHEQLGVQRQVELCLDYAERRGVDVPPERVFIDNDISAMSGKHRPEYERLMKLVTTGEIKTIVVYQTTRLWRRPTERVQAIELLRENRVSVMAQKGPELDMTTAYGRSMARQLGEFDTLESEVKSERQLDEQLQRARRGVPPTGPRCFGYTADGRHLVPREAEAVADCFRLFIAGETIRGLTRELHRRGLVTSRGAPFSDSTVRGMLLKARYCGRRVLYGEEHPGDWPAIVSEAQWRAAVAIIKDPARRTTHRYERTRLGSGLYRCGPCALAGVETTLGPCKRHGQPGYRCEARGHLARVGGPIDLVVEAAVIGRLSRPDAVDLLVDRDAPDLEALQAEATALRERVAGIAVLLGRGAMTAGQFETANREAQGALEAVLARLRDAQRAPVLGDLLGAEDVAGAWERTSLGRRRAVVDTLMTVTVLSANRSRVFNPETVRVDWKR